MNQFLFSEQQGLRPIKVLQTASLDRRTKNRIWNVISSVLHYQSERSIIFYLKHILAFTVEDAEVYFIGQAINSTKIFHEIIEQDLPDIFDYIQYFLQDILVAYEDKTLNLIKTLNWVFEDEKVAYRILNTGQIVPILDNIAKESLETTVQHAAPDVKKHFEQALSHFANRENPDYRNSMKSAFEALEHLVQEASCLDDYSKGLDKLQQKYNINGALVQSLKSLLGYASQTCRHANANKTQETLRQEDALLMLIQCSGYINYLKQKIEIEK